MVSTSRQSRIGFGGVENVNIIIVLNRWLALHAQCTPVGPDPFFFRISGLAKVKHTSKFPQTYPKLMKK